MMAVKGIDGYDGVGDGLIHMLDVIEYGQEMIRRKYTYEKKKSVVFGDGSESTLVQRPRID